MRIATADNGREAVASGEVVVGDEHCSAIEGCITCGDVAVELGVVAIDAGRGLALCADDADRRETVETALVAPLAVGDRLLVHAGTAIAKVSP
jgi:hydrogenase expression/formation protein HypC